MGDTDREAWCVETLTERRKLFGFLECDTIFSGDFTREGKIHTVENLCRVIGALCLFFAGAKDIWWLGLIGIPLIGVVLRSTPDQTHIDVKVW